MLSKDYLVVAGNTSKARDLINNGEMRIQVEYSENTVNIGIPIFDISDIFNTYKGTGTTVDYCTVKFDNALVNDGASISNVKGYLYYSLYRLAGTISGTTFESSSSTSIGTTFNVYKETRATSPSFTPVEQQTLISSMTSTHQNYLGLALSAEEKNSITHMTWRVKNLKATVSYTPRCRVTFYKKPENADNIITEYVDKTVTHEQRPVCNYNEYKDWIPEGYEFAGWHDTIYGNIYGEELPICDCTRDRAFQLLVKKKQYDVNFRNLDGSIFSTSKIEYGSSLGTLPIPTRAGYEFAGWLPCAPAITTKTNQVVDSYLYQGDAKIPLNNYKYKDKFSLHIEAYMDDWMNIKDKQIISCTEGGGWGLGYQANTKVNGVESHGFKIATGTSGNEGYTGYNLNFGTEGAYSPGWHVFDVVFSNGELEVYVDGSSRGKVTTIKPSIFYHSSNAIFVGAEAGASATEPNGGYFVGKLSNVFIANQGERLVQPTENLIIYNQIDYYPIWRVLKLCTIKFLNYDNSPLQTKMVYQGEIPTYDGPTPTRPNDNNYRYEFSGWSPQLDIVTNDISYVAQFKAIPIYYLTVNKQGEGVIYMTPEGPYDYNTSVILEAYPSRGYKFVKWSDENTKNIRNIYIKDNINITAIFEELKMVFKSVKVYSAFGKELITSERPLTAEEPAEVVIQVALE